MRAKMILLLAGFLLAFAPSGAVAKDRHHTGQKQDKLERLQHGDKHSGHRHGGLPDHHKQRGPGHHKHAQGNPGHPHGGPPGHQKQRGLGHHKHAQGDLGHPHGGPPGHRKHHDHAETPLPEKVLDAILGD